MVWGRYHEQPWKQKRKIGQRDQQFPGRYTDWRPNLLHGKSTAVFVGSRTVDSLLPPAGEVEKGRETGPFGTGVDTHTQTGTHTHTSHTETHALPQLTRTHTQAETHTHTDIDTHIQRPTHCLNSPDLTLHTEHLTDNPHSDFLRDEKCFRATRRLVFLRIFLNISRAYV